MRAGGQSFLLHGRWRGVQLSPGAFHSSNREISCNLISRLRAQNYMAQIRLTSTMPIQTIIRAGTVLLPYRLVHNLTISLTLSSSFVTWYLSRYLSIACIMIRHPS